MNEAFATTFTPIVGGTQTAAFTGTSAAISNAVGSQTRVVRLYATQDCYVAVGASPTATTSDMPLPAGAIEYIKINPGEKVAAVQISTGGNLHVTEMS